MADRWVDRRDTPMYDIPITGAGGSRIAVFRPPAAVDALCATGYDEGSMVRGREATRADGVQTRLGPYVLRRWLAQGGMAELYLAHQAGAAQGPVVVIKKILPQYAQDMQFARMFAREAEVALRLHHPNCVAVYDSGSTGEGEFYLAMEFVHGSDLSRMLSVLREHETTVPLEAALTIVIGMCAGLHHAHEQIGDDGQPLGIVHRDVSPSNVLVGYDGSVKITDFGVAKAMALTSFTQAGTRKGKLSYMSPEQARADAIDRRSDVFAIGVVLYELTTGERMFGGDNELAIMHQLLFRGPKRPSEVVVDYPPALEEIVMRAVATEPGQRFETALEMQQALEGFARDLGLTCSASELGDLVAQLVPGTAHPAMDPSFFQGGDIGAREDLATAVDHPTSGTFPSYRAQTQASGPGTNFAAAATLALGSPGSVSAPVTTNVTRTTGARPVVGPRWGMIAGIGSALAVTGLAAGVWLGLQPTEEPTPTAGPPAEAEVSSPSAENEPPSPAPQHGEVRTDGPPSASPPAVAPAAPQPVAPIEVEPAPETDPRAARASDPPTKKPARRRRAAKKDPETPTSSPSPAKQPPPPPPPPDSKRTKKSPTDTLLPILEE